MNLYALYMSMITFSSIFGVYILFLTQYLVIHRKSLDEWIAGLPVTSAACFTCVVLCAVISYILLKPILAMVNKSKHEELSVEEKLSFLPAFKKLAIFSRIFLVTAFLGANGSVAILKAHQGVIYTGATPGEQFLTQFMFMGLALLYGFIAIEYTTHYFEIFAQKTIIKLGIINIPESIKTKDFTISLSLTIAVSGAFILWNVLCSGYGIVRFPDRGYTLSTFMKTAVPMGLWAFVYTVPAICLYLRNLKNRMNKLSNKIMNLRLAGDLTQRLDIAQIDNFGKINSEVNNLMDFLSGVIKNIASNTGIVRGRANELLEGAESSMVGIKQIVSEFDDINVKSAERDILIKYTQQSIIKLSEESKQVRDSMTSQASAIEENAASVNQMVANISSINELVTKAREVSTSLAESSSRGGKEVKDTINVIAEIAQKSSEMTNMVKVIQVVSSETNLLAMNAAIEAAHAGTYGQGFAVVADEIRSLAESTSESTKQIKSRIDEIVNLIEESSKSIETTSESFNQINNGINEQLQIVENISNAMDEQFIGAKETLNVTNTISSQIVDVVNLVRNQAQHAKEMEENINKVVDISKQVDDSLHDSVDVIHNFENNLNTISIGSEQNSSAVDQVQLEIEKFSM